MQADLRMDCSTLQYHIQRIYAIVSIIIWPVGVPMSFLVLLLRINVKRLDPSAESEEEAVAIRSEDVELKRSVVYQVFRKYRWVLFLHRLQVLKFRPNVPTTS